jgi:hypothetical protein
VLTLATDHFDLRAKLESIGYSGLREDDESLIQALVAVYLTVESFNLSKEAQGAVLSLLSAVGQASLAEPAELKEEQWQDFDYGNVRFGDLVRVKRDAYDSETGARHNGLVGVLTGMKAGVCTVEYIGLATGNTMRHPKERLDSLKMAYNRRPTKT